MKIVKTRSPETTSGKIVTRPTGEQIWWLVALEDQAVSELNLQDSVIENSAAFFAQRKIGKQFEEGQSLQVGEVIAYEDSYYRVIQAHTTQDDWTPDTANSLFVETDPYNIDNWKAPTGAHDAPNRRDLREHNGEIWRSVIDGNTIEPGTDARYWVREGQQLPENDSQVPEWSSFASHEFQSMEIGKRVTDADVTYELTDPAQGHRQPSGPDGHFGWIEVQ